MDVNDQVIHAAPIRGRELRQAENLFTKPFFHVLGGYSGGVSLDAISSLRMTWTKKTSTPLNTVSTTPSSVKMPQFMATASGESVMPVQAAQAQSDVGQNAKAKSRTARSFLNLPGFINIPRPLFSSGNNTHRPVSYTHL